MSRMLVESPEPAMQSSNLLSLASTALALLIAAAPMGATGATTTGAPALASLTEAEQQWLADHGTIRLGIDPAWEPFEFVDDQGRYRGMASDYISLLNDLLDVRMRPVPGLDWATVIESAKRGEIDVLPCVVATPQRREYLSFTRDYLDFPMVIVTRDDASFVSGLEDFVDERIGVVKGYASVDLIRLNYPNLQLVEFPTLAEGLETLSLGRIDAFVDNLATIVTGIKRSSITNIKVAAKTPFSFKLAIGVRSDWPELVTILDKALASLTDDQTTAIRNDWIQIKFEHGVDLPFVAKVALASASAMILVLTVIFIWNRRLVNEVERRTQAEHTLARRNRILEQISEHRALAQILESLVLTVESGSPGMLGSVLLLDRQGKRLLKGAAPSLPDFYNEAIDGIEVGPGVGSCGHAAFTGSRVIAEDLRTHPNWVPFRELVDRTELGVLVRANRLHDRDGARHLRPVLHRTEEPQRGGAGLIGELALQAAMAIEHYASAEWLRKLSLAVEHSPNAVCITDREGAIQYVNPRFSAITSYESSEVIGRTPRLLQADMPTAQQDELWSALRDGHEWTGEVRNQRKGGAPYWAHELVSPIVDHRGEITHFVWLQEDVTDARENNEKISHQATHDALTGLLNRYEFERRLAHARRSSEDSSEEHTLCFLDLDQFKVVNDTVGHAAGDELLRQLGTLLRDRLRKQDSLARFGGDEFAVLMEHCSIEPAREKAEALRHVIEQYRFSWDERVFNVGVSIGLAPINARTGTVSDALRHADIACYAAKDSGRNRVHVYEADDEVSRKRSGEMVWATRISRALEADAFTLFVQPMVSVTDSRTPVGYEVLLRMIDGDGSLLMPGAFLPAAERYNLATRIDRWVIDKLFEWLRANPSALASGANFAVNLSGQSMGDSDLLAHLVGLFQSDDVPRRRIKFEITETAAIANLSNANVFITTLGAHGVEFALDDFGSGLSSFGYLKNLHVDYLKIDGMFVRDLLSDPIDAAMVKSINDIGHVMGKKTIAEFVENDAILAELGRIGVDYAQGYGIGRPMPIENLVEMPSRKAG